MACLLVAVPMAPALLRVLAQSQASLGLGLDLSGSWGVRSWASLAQALGPACDSRR